MKRITMILLAIGLAATAIGQNDPLSLSRQKAFQSGNYPVYTSGGFKVLVRNNATGLLNITSYTQVYDTVNGHYLIKGNGGTGHGLDLTTNSFHAYYWAGLNRGGGKTKLQDTSGTYYVLSTSDSGVYHKYPVSVQNQVISVSAKPGLKYGLGAKGQGYVHLQDSNNSVKYITVDPLTGITSKDTLFSNQQFLSVKTAAGNVAMTSDTVQTTINSGKLRIGGASAPVILTGQGSPLNAVSAPIGSIYLRTNGVADSTLYIKSVGTGSSGWYPLTTH